jgi:hypothetical protein
MRNEETVQSDSDRGSRPLRPLGPLAALLAAAFLVAWLPSGALAQDSYRHGGIDDCETCHVNAHTWWTPTNEHCTGCHAGYKVPHRGLLCWTCHTPGQDMKAARSDAACIAACHLPGGSTVTHVAHPGGSAACTSCHPVSASPSDPAGSPHHSVPPPVLTAFTPAVGVPGTTVTLTGSHFSEAVAVAFNGVWAPFVIVSDVQMTATVPAAATAGPISVFTPGGEGTSAGSFFLRVDAALTLAVTPATSAPGRRVRMTGTLAPLGIAGAAVTLVVQRRAGEFWRTVKTGACATSAAGAYSWSYVPPRTGAYRVRSSIGESAAHTASRTSWSRFTVK